MTFAKLIIFPKYNGKIWKVDFLSVVSIASSSLLSSCVFIYLLLKIIIIPLKKGDIWFAKKYELL